MKVAALAAAPIVSVPEFALAACRVVVPVAAPKVLLTAKFALNNRFVFAVAEKLPALELWVTLPLNVPVVKALIERPPEVVAVAIVPATAEVIVVTWEVIERLPPAVELFASAALIATEPPLNEQFPVAP